VVGAGGQVGGALLAHLGERALGTWRSPPPGGHAADLEALAADPASARALVGEAGAGVVVVAAGMTWVDGCEQEPDLARRVNADGPAALARAAAATGARTVYLSTEYVFDGTAGPYGEDDPVSPLSVYGRSKLEGEQAVQAADPAALVLRTTVVYGPEGHGRNFAYQLVGRLGRGEAMRVPGDQVSSPTYNRDLAEALVALVDAGVSGVVNVAGPEIVDRAHFARRLAGLMGLDATLIEAVPTSALGQTAPRPLDAGLRIDRLRELLPWFTPRGVTDAVAHWDRTAPPPPWRSAPAA
jgi:dTDP-4-dehydrorhamnose reductase